MDITALISQQKFTKLHCPTNTKIAKLTNKFIKITFDARNRIDNGGNMDIGQFTDWHFNDSAISEDNCDD